MLYCAKELLVLSYFPGYLGQETAKWPYDSSCHLSNHSKGGGIQFSTLPKKQVNCPACYITFFLKY